MANIRIDNASDDALSVELDGKKYFIAEDESISVSNVTKGSHKLVVHRSKQVGNDDGQSDDEENESTLFSKDEQSLYVLLKSSFDIEVNSSKSIWTVKRKSELIEKSGVDVLLSGCEIEVSGGKLVESNQVFADKKVKKSFLKKQLRSAFFPIGIGIIIFTILGIVALNANISGSPITLGGRTFTYPWTLALCGIDLVFIGYFILMLINIFKTAKKYSE